MGNTCSNTSPIVRESSSATQRNPPHSESRSGQRTNDPDSTRPSLAGCSLAVQKRTPLPLSDGVRATRHPRSGLKYQTKCAAGNWIVSKGSKSRSPHERPTPLKMMISKPINTANFATVAQRGTPTQTKGALRLVTIPTLPHANDHDAFQSPHRSLHLLGSPSVGNDHLVLIDVHTRPSHTCASPLHSTNALDAFGSRGQSMRLSRENSKSSYSSSQLYARAPHSERHEGNPLE